MQLLRQSLLIVALVSMQGECPCWGQELTAEDVQRAIDRGVNFLHKTQNAEGGWTEINRYPGGVSALCTLALMNAGFDDRDPTVNAALKYLRTFPPKDTYTVSLQTMVFCHARQPQDLPDIRRNVKWLEQAQRPVGSQRAGSWTYGMRSESGLGGDPSNAQFALLALSAAEERGIPVSPEVFERAESYWTERQRSDGGWSYVTSGNTSGSMTCAGIASLVITRSRTSNGHARIENGRIRCCGVEIDERDHIGDALNWLGKNFAVTTNPGVQDHLLYYLYALERVGRLTGQRLLGGADWYRQGARHLLSIQDDFDGSWLGGRGENQREVATSLALLFLSKGKRRVVVSRLQHGMGNDWNWHPDALRQLTRQIERRWKQDLTWQNVRLGGASVEDLLQSPILFLSGSGPIVATQREKETLRSYIEQGGFIFAQATAGAGCQDASRFEQSLRDLCSELFDAPLKKLPAAHSIWSSEHRLKPEKLPPRFWLYGVQACCRTSIVYCPVSLACLWQLSDPTGRNNVPQRFEESVDAAVKVGQNVVAYATGRQLNDKLDRRSIISPETAQRNIVPGTLVVPRLLLGAGGEEAPRALPNLMEWMRGQVKSRITSFAPEVVFNERALEEYPIIFVHGRFDFSFSAEQREVLRHYVETDGTIIASSVCGSSEFSQAFRREMQLVLPESKMVPLPADHEAFTSRFKGYNLASVTLQQPTSGSGGTVVNRKVGIPLIEVMKHNDRDCVLFSPYDLSCALENQGGIQCTGYNTVDAAKIGINLILYAMLR